MNPRAHFWRVAGIFGLLTLLVLALQWRDYQIEEQNMMTQMMGQSMGEMMRMMHASNITLAQLFLWQNHEGVMSNTQQMGQAAGALQWMHLFTTNVIYLVLPFIMAGTVFLLIAWYN